MSNPNKEGEVEQKVTALGNEIFEKYCPDDSQKDPEGKPCITKDNLRTFIMNIMTQADEMEAWDEEDFEQGYY